MKKILVTILALVYLVASMGATVHLHYCMDKLVAWGLGNEKNGKKSCPYCGMAKTTKDKHCISQKDGCCKDEQKQVKIEKDQDATSFQYNFSKQFEVLSSYSLVSYFPTYIISPVLEFPTTHAPPFEEKVPVFVRNCVFRI